jgi:hypothetical protein
MPSGYTAPIAKRITFQQFALDCARAFGACITLRDEPGGGEQIPDAFEPSDYHLKAIDRTRTELERLSKMSAADCTRAANQEWEQAEVSRLERLQKALALRASYEDMLNQVERWNPPTDDHHELKKFMREQITESIRFDCSTEHCSKPCERLSGEEWLQQKIKGCEGALSYHREHYAKEVKRAAEQTAWVKALRESLV